MYKIRYATYHDAEILAEIHTSAWKIAYKNIVPDEILDNITAEKRKKYFEKALTEAWEEDVIIFNNDTSLGLICLGKCRDEDKPSSTGEVWGIYLHPSYWNQGIGKELMTWGLNELKHRNYKEVTLWVLEDNLMARRFYEKMGFKHDGTVKEINLGKALNEYRYVTTI